MSAWPTVIRAGAIRVCAASALALAAAPALCAPPGLAEASTPLQGRTLSVHLIEQREQAHTLALAGHWSEAADWFVAIAAQSDEAADRLAAMRALAQSGRRGEAIGQGVQMLAKLQSLSEAQANAAKTELANLYAEEGYRLRRDADARQAAQAFENALSHAPARVRLRAEAGYARLAAADRALAAEHFEAAIDALAKTEPGVRRTGEATDDDDHLLRERLRRELTELRRLWTLALFQSWRPRGNGPSAAFSGLQRDGLVAAQGGVELAVRASAFSASGPQRETDVFVRALWSQRADSLAIDTRSAQGAAGVRWQPVAGSALRLSAEHLFALGSDARSDWLVRVAWGHVYGGEPSPGRSSWPAGQVYIDAGRFLRGEGSNAAFAEARHGRAVAMGSGWVAVPHLSVAGRAVRPDLYAESWLEAGPGIALRRTFGGSARQADPGRLELVLQYRFAVSGSARQGWMVTGSLVW